MYKQCDQKVQKWLDLDYIKIKGDTKKEDTKIHWGVETKVRNNAEFHKLIKIS